MLKLYPTCCGARVAAFPPAAAFGYLCV